MVGTEQTRPACLAEYCHEINFSKNQFEITWGGCLLYRYFDPGQFMQGARNAPSIASAGKSTHSRYGG